MLCAKHNIVIAMDEVKFQSETLPNMTTLKSALAICGLSQTEAARYLNVSLQTVKHWSSGRTRPRAGVWMELADLYAQITEAADFAAGHIEIEGVDPLEWGHIAADFGQKSLAHGENIAGAMALLTAVRASE